MKRNGFKKLIYKLRKKLRKWIGISKINKSLKSYDERTKNSFEVVYKTIEMNNKELMEIYKDIVKEQDIQRNDLSKMLGKFFHIERDIDRMKPLMAVDVNFYDTGKIILIQKADKRDMVKIINIAPQTTLSDFRIMVKSIESMFGAHLNFVDAPDNCREFFKE